MKNTTLKINHYETEAPLPVYEGGEPTDEFLHQLQQYEADKRRAKLTLPIRIVRRTIDRRAEEAQWRQHIKLVEKKTKAIDQKYGTHYWQDLCDQARDELRKAEVAKLNDLLGSHNATSGYWLGPDHRRQGRRHNGQFTAKS